MIENSIKFSLFLPYEKKKKIGKPIERPIVPINYCLSSPCGPNSQCTSTANGAICSCIANYIGRPPNCRPECTINTDCPAHRACVNLRCIDPCIGCCGNNAQCQVSAHTPVCMCEEGFTGDPFSGCFKIIKSMISMKIIHFFFL